ncbi:ABC transporter substrate-binding protein [Paenarthrobacter sp. AB444]|uniref:ABC transporter substrate-binding protein n=1 Tax=Paenarthrobacter sp. AB444 TaxID=3025681 RepID=UPI0023660EB9|nr:extracellular solute-binding protein [Paenarthrobacter sp. AB444]MDD7833900.1 extracellular solute-binding protein [Paenarthrobacter sp. AB444]
MKTRKTAMLLGSITLASAIVLSGCGTSSPGATPSTGPVSQADIDKALDTPTTLTYWTWIDGVQQSVDMFKKKHPKIDVNVVNVGSGADEYAKLRAALKAGKGFPDVAQIGYDYLGSFQQTESLLNLAPYGGDKLKDQFTESTWNQVSNKDGVWAVPQDSGPLGTLYRDDIFKKAGLDGAPATWDDFATAAETIKSKTGSYITNMPGNDMPQWVGMFWQAGVKPFEYKGGTEVGIKVNSDEAKKVIGYWQDLIKKDLVSVDPDFTDEFYQGLAKGKYASWVVPAWGPQFLQGTVKDTSGLWRAAEPPQWTKGAHVSGNWGGSSNAVIAKTANPIAAYELAKFVNSELESTIHLANDASLFPTTTKTLESAEFTDAKSEFFGGQQVNKLYAEIATNVDPNFDFLPFMDFANSSFNETLGTAITNRGDLLAGLDAWQDKLVNYAKQQGFTVK